MDRTAITRPNRGRWAALLFAALLSDGVARSDDVARPEGELTVSARVVDRATGRPIAGASVAARAFEDNAGRFPVETPRRVVASTTSDGEGRFSVAVPAGLAARDRVDIEVSHPDYAAGYLEGWDIARFVRGELLPGDLALDRGIDYVGEVVTPDGRPVAGVQFAVRDRGPMPGREGAMGIRDTPEGRTDARGRFRVRMHPAPYVEVFLIPDDFAPAFHQPGRDPMLPLGPGDHSALNPDLGRFVLDPGARVSGRVVDREGRPIAGQVVRADVPTVMGVVRKATTDEAGRFSLAPLPPGTHQVAIEGQASSWGPAIRPGVPIIAPRRVEIEAGKEPGPVTLREVEAVALTVRFVDPAGQPARGARFTIRGTLFDPEAKAPPPRPAFAPEVKVVAMPGVRPPEPTAELIRARGMPVGWGCTAEPDGEDRVTLRVPRGLFGPTLTAWPAEPAALARIRLKPDGPPLPWPDAPLDAIDADLPGVTVVISTSPRVIVTLVTADGLPPKDLMIFAIPNNPRALSGMSHVLMPAPGGRFEGAILPDEEMKITARALGYHPDETAVKAAVGETVRVTLTLRPDPNRPRSPERVADGR